MSMIQTFPHKAEVLDGMRVHCNLKLLAEANGFKYWTPDKKLGRSLVFDLDGRIVCTVSELEDAQ